MKIKGVIISSRKEYVKKNFGEPGWRKVLEALPAADREVLEKTTLSTSWYPFEIGNRLDAAVVAALGGGRKTFFEDLGAVSAKASLSAEHKPFLSNDPQAFMKKAGTIYRFYYDTGHREYQETGPTSGVMTTYDSESFSTPDCLTVIGWYKEALKMCGASDVTIVEEQCRAQGGSCCKYLVQWKLG
jgi:uncharacterized protein (TIGR02265 family)